MIWQTRYAALQGCVLPFEKHLLIHSETKWGTILVSESLNHSLNRFFSKTPIQSGTKLPRVAPTVDTQQCCCGFIWKTFSGGALKCMLLNIYLFIELLYKALSVLTFIRKKGVLEFSAIPQTSYGSGRSVCFSIFVYVNMRQSDLFECSCLESLTVNCSDLQTRGSSSVCKIMLLQTLRLMVLNAKKHSVWLAH